MLLALNKIEEIVTQLENEIKENKITDFKIFLKPNLEINVTIVSSDATYEILNFNQSSIKFEVISESDKRFDPYYNQLFSNTNGKVELGFKRRFASFNQQKTEQRNEIKTPVVTFYSYKGGMGRSTTLITYAMYCAINEGKKILILDCDFEAPGYLNFFNLANNERLLNGEVNGVVEYLLDASFINAVFNQ